MNNPLISVIVPIYKVEKYLDRCVESIVNQSYLNLEIILVDDGSPDNCPQMCDRWANLDERIKVIHKENGGLSSARNAGLDVCTGEYISFIDGDDWIEPTMFQSMLNACLLNNVQLAVCGRYVVLEESGLRRVDKCPIENAIIDSKSFVAQMLIGKNCDSSACDKLYHKTLWRDIRFPEGKIYEDVAIMYKVVLNSTRVVTYNIPLYNYFRHTDSITTGAFNSKWFDYPFNTGQLLQDIENNHPELIDYACWTHMKAIGNVLAKLYASNSRDARKYVFETKNLSQEVYSYKKIWNESSVFSDIDRRLCKILSRWYIAKIVFKIKKRIKKIRKKIKRC